MFEIVDEGRADDDGLTPDHGYTISSYCEPSAQAHCGQCPRRVVITAYEPHPRLVSLKSKAVTAASIR